MSSNTPTAATVSSSRAIAAYILGTVFFLYAFVQRVSPSVMTSELMREFSADAATIGALSSMYFYTYAAIQIPIGVLIDRYGPRKLLAFSAVVSAIASLGFAFSNTVLLASISRAIIGASVAFAFVGTLSIAATFFKPARFAMLAGILLAVGMMGALLGQAPLRLLVETSGWRGSFHVLAIWALALAFLAWLIIPNRRQAGQVEAASQTPMIAWPVFSNVQTWCCSFAGFGVISVLLAFGSLWSVPWLMSVYYYSASDASLLTSTMFIGSLVSSPLAGWYSDKIQRRKPVLAGGMLVSFFSFGVLVLVPELNKLTLIGLYFISGAGASCMVVCFGLVREWNSPKGSATAIGFTNTFVVGSGAIMQPLVGILLDSQWQGLAIQGVRQYPDEAFKFAFMSILVVLLLSNIVVVFVKESYCKQQCSDTVVTTKSN